MHHNRCAIEGHQWFMSAALTLIPFMTVSAYRILIEGPRHFYTRTPLWTYFRLTSQEDEACVDPSDTFGNFLEQQVCFRDGCDVREGSGTIWQQSRRSRLLGNAWRRHLFLVSSLQVFFRTRPPISTNELFFFFFRQNRVTFLLPPCEHVSSGHTLVSWSLFRRRLWIG